MSLILTFLLASWIAGQAFAQTTPPAFQRLDKNRDGKLTRKEYPRPEAFPNVDLNSDGFATLEEVRAYFRSRRSRRAPNR